MMVSGMNDYHIPEVAAMCEEPERGVYCANEQLGNVINCDHIMT